MPAPSRDKWWDAVVSVDTHKLNDLTYLLWGDRVKVLSQPDGSGRVRIAARGAEGWVDQNVLGGQPLLELYFIDVGQGDGVLAVTPEGHHILIDGGLPRARQGSGKSAADFVDWKFHYDYLAQNDRDDAETNAVRIDAMIASHADLDHYGGLYDLIDRTNQAKADELDTASTTVEAFYHQGLCPQTTGTEKLGPKSNGFFTRLLTDRASVAAGVSANPGNAARIRGEYRKFMDAVLSLRTADDDATPISRLSHADQFLPGFSDADSDSAIEIRVLAPIEHRDNGTPVLRDLGDEGVNKNGHSVALRLDYRDRRILLTGDLNEQSQEDILQHYGPAFESSWRADVAKACHHGSHHVRHEFLRGVNALSTVFSSGDANTYDHPRAWVLGAAALTGRVIEDTARDRLVAPLIYSTEVARSIALKDVEQLRRYDRRQEFGFPQGDQEEQRVSGAQTISKWRLVLEGSSKTSFEFPPLWGAKAMQKMIYGLVNVRTDGRRLLFAVRNEGNASWAYEVMEADQIDNAFTLERPA